MSQAILIHALKYYLLFSLSLPYRLIYPLPDRSLPLRTYLTVYSVIKKIWVIFVISKIVVSLQ